MIVVDTAILAYLWIPGTRSEQARELLSRDSDWNAPLLWRSEFRNVLITYFRKGLMNLFTAQRTMAAAELQMSHHEFELSSAEVLRLVASSPCSAYDCEFVALAQELGVPLITVDRQVLAAFPDTARPLAEYPN